MGRHNHHKEKYEKSGDVSQDKYNDGTAARTRPLSFDEIMLRRKNKKKHADGGKGVAGVSGHVLGKDIVEMISDHLEADKFNKDSVPSAVRHASEGSVKVSSRNNETDSFTKEGKLGKAKDKGRLDSETKSRVTLERNVVNDKARRDKSDGSVHGKRKTEDLSTNDSEDEYEKQHSRDRGQKDRTADRESRISEKESKKKYRSEDNNRGVHRERKSDERITDDSRNGAEKRHSRDAVGKERYADRSRGNHEKDRERRNQNEDDERGRDRNATKKHGSGKWHDPEFSEKKGKKESTHVSHEDSRQKRIRSRSRERDKEKGRKSISLSPRARRRTPYDVKQHEDLSSHPSKDRFGRSQTDVDRKGISTNGSNNHRRRQGESSSGLGGYSPRKRRTEAVVKVPSPINRSPEKRSGGWDIPSAGKESSVIVSALSSLPSSDQTAASKAHEFPSVVPVTSITPKPFSVFPMVSSSIMNPSIDSIHLTQATRPMRRLYIDNLSPSTSEKAVMQCINSFLLSSGANYIRGTQPCISCIIHKEKGQAVVEFLTPEDASAALLFDGRLFEGTILKIRRPKDFVEVTTGVPKESVAEGDSVSDIVGDSPHKIFIGGIPKVVSYEMIKQIVGVFGALKAFHFEITTDVDEQCAFLEYVDHSVIPKACAGLNGMRLGGQVLTVVQAFLDISSEKNDGNQPFYGIPEHAKPLLEKPTKVLKLRNVLDPEGISSMSEAEVEEILEDVRLECSRFGTVKSLNIVKHDHYFITHQTPELWNIDQQDLDSGNKNRMEPSNSDTESEKVNIKVEVNCFSDDDQSRLEPSIDFREAEEANKASEEGSTVLDDEITYLPPSDNVTDIIQTNDIEMGNVPSVKGEPESEETKEKLNPSSELDGSRRIELNEDKKGENGEQVFVEEVLDPGLVLVEYRREEAACLAAHSLHMRLFDGRIVTVGYISHDVYCARFGK